MELDPMIRLTGLGLRFYVDDEGRGSATPALIRSQLWPLESSMENRTIQQHLRVLAKLGYIELYSVNGRKLLAVLDWPAVDRGVRSSLPPPPSFDPFAKPSRTSRASFAVVGGGEGEGREAGPGAGGPSRTIRDDEPSPFCRKHQPAGTDNDCGGCASARKRHDLWLREQARLETDDLTGADE